MTTEQPQNDKDSSITTLLAAESLGIQSARDAAEMLFSKPIPHLRARIKDEILRHEVTEEELNIAANFGRFPYRPSDLFLKLFHNVLCTLKRDPSVGCVSPSLIGTSGVIPLSIISTIPDIMQHYYHCIVHAQREVLLATNYWEKSVSVSIIAKALRALNKRAENDGRVVIVKIMIDHPTLDNLLHYHSILPVDKWPDYDIPLPHEIPHLSLEVNNYHRMIMGTFHSKFMIVDRRLALLNSNNIQDRPNLEMMSHFEGEIVHSFYDTYLISWWVPFQPNLVCLKRENDHHDDYQFGMNNRQIFSLEQPLKHAIAKARLRLQHHLEHEGRDGSDVYFDRRNNSERFSSVAIQAFVHHRRSHSPSVLAKATSDLTGAIIGHDMTPRSDSPLTIHLNKSSQSARSTKSDGSLSDEELERLTFDFCPFIFHRPHQPIPIALVNRPARGTPGHVDTANPQDAAWMGAFRFAKKSVFIQSPTLNASPAIEGIIDACRRGITVTLWLGLGFNDLVEGFGTFQGGTNEQVVKKLYKKLHERKDGAEKFLEVFWYTGKGTWEVFEEINSHQRNSSRSNTTTQFLSKMSQLSY